MPHPSPEQQPADWWEDRYASGGITWSGKPNDLLVSQTEALAPGRALDLGCGTGGDALWLAGRGWQVTAVDIAQAALDQAAAHAAEAGLADRISFERHDFDHTFPAGEFDLVSACYLQSPFAFERLATLRRAAAAVARGGTLVLISHETRADGAAHDPALYLPTAEQLCDDLALDPAAWAVEHLESLPRQRTRPDGTAIDYRDNILRARRA